VFLFKATCFGLNIDHHQLENTIIKSQVKYEIYKLSLYFMRYSTDLQLICKVVD